MSVLIRGMEMPKPKLADMATVYDAYILVRPNGHAAIVVDNEDGLDSKEYPLIPVPPHGRLIDGDAVVRKIESFCGTHWTTMEIKRAPTIIPAEEG